ncbi:MAG TPA: site-2 protease family protein [Anaerolineaceae bacterium]|uniref:Peptidase M50 family protein n=1 Tax=Anaerolinea thermophila TaxID=167964 RepID=A0A117LGU5_9CHLR|nr:MAG: peptidase M50 family protein [Anaerolinea thermophila]HAF61119.1 site-2 protease family protein [Anaerolineaceae bacterium]
MINQLIASPSIFFTRILALLISLTFHEFAHAWTAVKLGDETPRWAGRLTLNPFKHLDPVGSLMLLLVGFGWAKPVPVNPYTLKRKHPAGLLCVALSGPLSNFLLAALAALPLRFGWVTPVYTTSTLIPSLFEFLLYFLSINLGLMLFNLLPIPPLDGEEILSFFLRGKPAYFYEQIRPYGSFILLGIIVVGQFSGFNLFSVILEPAMYGIAKFLLGA